MIKFKVNIPKNSHTANESERPIKIKYTTCGIARVLTLTHFIENSQIYRKL